MKSEDILKQLEERKDLAQRSYDAWQQLQGQIALLRDMYKKAKSEEEKDKKEEKLKTEEVK